MKKFLILSTIVSPMGFISTIATLHETLAEAKRVKAEQLRESDPKAAQVASSVILKVNEVG